MTLIGELQEAVYKQHFEDHPDKDAILEKIKDGEASEEEKETWIEEAKGHSDDGIIREPSKGEPPDEKPIEDEPPKDISPEDEVISNG